MVALRDALRPTVAVVDELRGIARALSTTGAAAAPPPPRAVSPATVARLTRDAIKAFTGVGFGFRLVIAGTHYSGLSNQALLEVRASEGRDFDANTAQLRQWLRRELLERFRGFGRVPPLDEIKREASRLVVNYIATVRVVGGGGDVFVPALTPRYAAWKAARGKGSKPVGVFTGRWMQALLRQGHAEFTHA